MSSRKCGTPWEGGCEWAKVISAACSYMSLLLFLRVSNDYDTSIYYPNHDGET